MTVDVLPLTRYPDEDSFQTKPQVLSVPVGAILGGGFAYRPVYKAGDIGVVLYLDRDSDATIAGGQEADPNTERLHSGDDAVLSAASAPGKESHGLAVRFPMPGNRHRLSLHFHHEVRH